jgi:hypothetical protein
VKLPPQTFTNRYGMPFGRSRNATIYAGSGRRWNSYYTHVCLRCGWAFKPPRHKAHRLVDCDIVRAQLGLRDVAWMVRLNLFGIRRRGPRTG